MQIYFICPLFLGLLALLPVLWFWPKNSAKIIQKTLRTVFFLLIIVSLAQPFVLTKSAGSHQVFILDHSMSVSMDQRIRADEFLKTNLASLQKKDKVTVLELGSESSGFLSESDRKSQYPAGQWLQLRDSAGTSSLSMALETAEQQIPADSAGVVTLISDGLSTDHLWGQAISLLANRNIPVYCLDLGVSSMDIYPVDIQVQDGSLLQGQDITSRVTVIGEGLFHVTLSDQNGRELVKTKTPVSIIDRREVTLSFEAQHAGFQTIIATIQPVQTSSASEEHSLQRVVAVQLPIKALYLGSRIDGAKPVLQQMLGNGYVLELPRYPLDDNFPLDDYQLVILDDKPAKEVPIAFQKHLLSQINETGLGLFFSGGEASFGTGGYYNSPLAEALPVQFKQHQEKKNPSTGLAIIVDSSGSMEGQPMDLAKQVAILAVRRLQEHDRVGIVEFYGAKHWAVPMQSATNKLTFERAIGRMQATGSTVLLPAIEEAYYGLKQVDTRFKHMIILTDAGVEDDDFESMLRKVAKDNINVSTIMIGGQGQTKVMSDMASWGKGRFYHVSDAYSLVDLILKKPTTELQPAYKRGLFPVSGSKNGLWWGDVNPASVPSINGYVDVNQRQGAETIASISSGQKPLLSSWRYGLGRVTALMTEPVGNGSRNWQAWPEYSQWLARAVKRTAADNQSWHFNLSRDRQRVSLTATGSGQPPALFATTGENDEKKPLMFREVAPRQWRAEVSAPLSDIVKISDEKQRQYLVSDPQTIIWPENQVDPELVLDMERLAKATGGGVLNQNQIIPSNEYTSRATSLQLTKLWSWLLAMAILIYLTELIYRRWPTTSRFV